MTAFLIPIAILVFALMLRTGWYKGRKLNWWWLGGVLAIVLIGATIWWWQSRPEKPKGGTADSGETVQPTVIVEKVGKVMTRYLFENGKNGCITTSYLVHDGAEFYPKGGSVIITAPSGVSWEDEPGTAHNRDPENPGVFKVCKKSPDAWGVDVWN